MARSSQSESTAPLQKKKCKPGKRKLLQSKSEDTIRAGRMRNKEPTRTESITLTVSKIRDESAKSVVEIRKMLKSMNTLIKTVQKIEGQCCRRICPKGRMADPELKKDSGHDYNQSENSDDRSSLYGGDAKARGRKGFDSVEDGLPGGDDPFGQPRPRRPCKEETSGSESGEQESRELPPQRRPGRKDKDEPSFGRKEESSGSKSSEEESRELPPQRRPDRKDKDEPSFRRKEESSGSESGDQESRELPPQRRPGRKDKDEPSFRRKEESSGSKSSEQESRELPPQRRPGRKDKDEPSFRRKEESSGSESGEQESRELPPQRRPDRKDKDEPSFRRKEESSSSESGDQESRELPPQRRPDRKDKDEPSFRRKEEPSDSESGEQESRELPPQRRPDRKDKNEPSFRRKEEPSGSESGEQESRELNPQRRPDRKDKDEPSFRRKKESSGSESGEQESRELHPQRRPDRKYEDEPSFRCTKEFSGSESLKQKPCEVPRAHLASREKKRRRAEDPYPHHRPPSRRPKEEPYFEPPTRRSSESENRPPKRRSKEREDGSPRRRPPGGRPGGNSRKPPMSHMQHDSKKVCRDWQPAGGRERRRNDFGNRSPRRDDCRESYSEGSGSCGPRGRPKGRGEPEGRGGYGNRRPYENRGDFGSDVLDGSADFSGCSDDKLGRYKAKNKQSGKDYRVNSRTECHSQFQNTISSKSKRGPHNKFDGEPDQRKIAGVECDPYFYTQLTAAQLIQHIKEEAKDGVYQGKDFYMPFAYWVLNTNDTKTIKILPLIIKPPRKLQNKFNFRYINDFNDSKPQLLPSAATEGRVTAKILLKLKNEWKLSKKEVQDKVNQCLNLAIGAADNEC